MSKSLSEKSFSIGMSNLNTNTNTMSNNQDCQKVMTPLDDSITVEEMEEMDEQAKATEAQF